MENTPFQSLLLRLLQDAYVAQQTWWSDLSEEEQSAVGTVERWSARDYIAHLTFWRRRLSEKLKAVWQKTPPSAMPAEFDEMNMQVFQQYRDKPLEDILRESEEAHQALLTLIPLFTDDDLISGHHDCIDAGEVLGVVIANRGYSHPLEHMAQYYLDRNDLPRARKIREALVEQLLQTEMPDQAKGIELYNLACFHATHNIPGRVLDNLQEALRFYPGLKEWALNDPDLLIVRHHIR